MVERPWASPELTGWRRLPMHAVRRPAGVPLDGRWRFQLLPAPDVTRVKQSLALLQPAAGS